MSPITKKQIEKRRNYTGSSDAAAIMGVSPWRTPYDIYLDKTGKLENGKSSAAAEVGNAFEKGILTLAEPHLGKLLLNQFRVLQGTRLASNCDALVIDTGKPVEAKLRRFDDDFGEPGTDQVADDIIVQAHVQMLCTASDLCHIAAVLAARGFKLQLFFVPFDKDIADTIIETTESFWNDYVLKDIPPEESQPSASVIKRIRREPKSVIDIPTELVEILQLKKAALKIAKKESEDADNILKAALGVAEAGRFEGGLVTFLQQTRKGYTVKESTYRVLRIKRDKK